MIFNLNKNQLCILNKIFYEFSNQNNVIKFEKLSNILKIVFEKKIFEVFFNIKLDLDYNYNDKLNFVNFLSIIAFIFKISKEFINKFKAFDKFDKCIVSIHEFKYILNNIENILSKNKFNKLKNSIQHCKLNYINYKAILYKILKF